MANIYFKIKVMPAGVEVDLNLLKESCKKEIEEFGANVHDISEEPIAFGLTALVFTALISEDKGSLDPLEEKLKSLADVNNAEVIDVRRAIG